jgi:hypothetical protein
MLRLELCGLCWTAVPAFGLNRCMKFAGVLRPVPPMALGEPPNDRFLAVFSVGVAGAPHVPVMDPPGETDLERPCALGYSFLEFSL